MSVMSHIAHAHFVISSLKDYACLTVCSLVVHLDISADKCKTNHCFTSDRCSTTHLDFYISSALNTVHTIGSTFCFTVGVFVVKI